MRLRQGRVPPDAAAAANKKKKKKKDKVRSAWISFAGRIVAQIVGAAATIVLGIYLVTNHRASSDERGAPRVCARRRAPPAPNRHSRFCRSTTTQATPVRTTSSTA